MIDLHTHSTASDGSLTPGELAEEADSIGLTAVALTDHDTVDGLPEFMAAAERLGFEGVRGVELSAQFPLGTMHLLGYFIRPRDGSLANSLAELKEARRERNPRIIARLNDLGIPLTMDEVEELAGPGQIGRPHIARALVNMKVARSINEAFHRLLKRGRAAYVEKFRYSPEKSIAIIRQAGGIASLAHPKTLEVTNRRLPGILKELRALGLSALEAYYPDHSPEETSFYIRTAKRLGLVVSGGTDFHGALKDQIRLGVGRSNSHIPDSVLSELKERWVKENG